MSDIDLIRENNRLREIIENLVEPEVNIWVNWTPTVDQGGAVTVTVTYARYTIAGNTAFIMGFLAVTGAGVAGNAISIQSVPSIIAPVNLGSNGIIGGGLISEAGVTVHVGALFENGVSDFRIIADQNGTPVGITPSFALASGDAISFQGVYER